MEISYREKEFHAGKYDFAPQKKHACYAPGATTIFAIPHFSSPTRLPPPVAEWLIKCSAPVTSGCLSPTAQRFVPQVLC